MTTSDYANAREVHIVNANEYNTISDRPFLIKQQL